MRTYHIYMQELPCTDFELRFRWLPYKYIRCVVGTKELYEFFKHNRFPKMNYSFENTFQYDPEKAYSLYLDREFLIYRRYVIVDDKGHIRDYYDLVSKHIKKKSNAKFHGAYQEHWGNYIRDKRNSITPEEHRETKEKYGFILQIPNKKPHEIYWGWYNCHKKSKSWKDQSKKRKQYLIHKT